MKVPSNTQMDQNTKAKSKTSNLMAKVLIIDLMEVSDIKENSKLAIIMVRVFGIIPMAVNGMKVRYLMGYDMVLAYNI